MRLILLTAFCDVCNKIFCSSFLFDRRKRENDTEKTYRESQLFQTKEGNKFSLIVSVISWKEITPNLSHSYDGGKQQQQQNKGWNPKSH